MKKRHYCCRSRLFEGWYCASPPWCFQAKRLKRRLPCFQSLFLFFQWTSSVPPAELLSIHATTPLPFAKMRQSRCSQRAGKISGFTSLSKLVKLLFCFVFSCYGWVIVSIFFSLLFPLCCHFYTEDEAIFDRTGWKLVPDFGFPILERRGVYTFVRLAWFRVNGTPEYTNFQPVENSSGTVWM